MRTSDQALALLRRLAPGADWRPGQREAIEAITEPSGRRRARVLVVQRTGWGKSAVYFIATKILRARGHGPTVIVSPLIALMRNQTEMATKLGIEARTVNSTNRDDWEPIFEAVTRREIDLLLISPERLNNPQFRSDILPDLLNGLGLLVIDEVHCISDWGHDFRPDYRRLSRIVERLGPSTPVIGTTATANDRVVTDVAEQLGNVIEIRGTLDRESLALQVIPLRDRATRMAWLSENIPQLPGSGIVYCLTVADAKRVGRWLQKEGIDAVTYTGQTDSADRLDIEDRLTQGTIDVVVATSALGMGYDNPRIEYVIHFQSPGSPVAYYQQVGRAGRAVDHSYGILLTGAEDLEIQDYFIRTAFPDPDDVEAILRTLEGSDGLRFGDLLSAVNLPATRITGMLKVLEVEGAVYRAGDQWHRSASHWVYPHQRVEAVTRQRRHEQRAMRTYVETPQCLMEFLRQQLDDTTAGKCGRCANCTPPSLTGDVAEPTIQRALQFLRRMHPPIPPRRQWPSGFGLPSLRESGLEEGRALSRWGDPGLARQVAAGKYEQHAFADPLVTATVDMILEWSPDPVPTWVTYVPAHGGGGIVADFAHRLADALDLPCVEALEKTRRTRPQKSMENTYQQVTNLKGAFRVVKVRPGPVFLIDDMVDSRWTFTIIGSLLRQAGAGPIYPVALADTSRGSA